MPYIGPGLAAPYRFMIKIADCSSDVAIADLELDGSNETLIIGGQYGDTGWQIPATGIALFNNRGTETVRNLYAHHHGQDGLLIDGVSDAAGENLQRTISHVRSEYNGRQGCSIVGGIGYVFERCRFAHTGRAAVASSPGAGVDIEAEGGKTNRDFTFTDCSFVDNVGAGLVADTGDSEGARFIRCNFVGTTNWSAWPSKPGFRFDHCTFAGALARAYGADDPGRAAQFLDCTFTDDPSLSPTGMLYGGTNTDRPLADLSDARNMLFARCRFLAHHGHALPWSVHAIYADCLMEQTAAQLSFPRGLYLGRSTIDGPVNLTGSLVRGELLVNGKRFANVRL